MFERIIPIIIALLALQLLLKFLKKQKMNRQTQSSSRDFDYKKKIDEFLKVSNYDEGINDERILTDKVRSGLGKPDLLLEIPESMRDVRRSLNLIIDGVTHGVKGKIGSVPGQAGKYDSPEKMFDEIVEVINRHIIK